MIPVDVAQNDPVHVIRPQAPLREALDHVVVAAYWVPRFDVFSDWWWICGERFPKSEVEKKTGGRWISVSMSGRRGMLY